MPYPPWNWAPAPEVEEDAAALALALEDAEEPPELAAPDVAEADVSAGPVEVLVPETSLTDTKVPEAKLASDDDAAVPLAAVAVGVVVSTGVMGSVGRTMLAVSVAAAEIKLLQKDGSYVVVLTDEDAGASVFSCAFRFLRLLLSPSFTAKRSAQSRSPTKPSPSQHSSWT